MNLSKSPKAVYGKVADGWLLQQISGTKKYHSKLSLLRTLKYLKHQLGMKEQNESTVSIVWQKATKAKLKFDRLTDVYAHKHCCG